MISKNKFPEQGCAGVPHQASVWAYLVAYVIPYVILFFVAICWPERTGSFGIDFTDSKLAQVPSISAYIEKFGISSCDCGLFCAFLDIIHTVFYARNNKSNNNILRIN